MVSGDKLDKQREVAMRKVILMMGLLLAGCGIQGEAEKKLAEKVSLTGQIFVVTKGRENIKLALVEVAAIPEKDMMQHLNAKYSNRLEQLKPLTPNLELVKKEADAAKVDLDNAFAVAGEYLTPEQASKTDKLEDIALSKKGIYITIRNQVAYLDSVKYYFEKLPAQLVASKTDADGKFTLTLPTGKYALAAKSSRDVFGTTENYYWLVWVDTSAPSHSVMLSNDNFFETGCGECVKPLNEPKPL